MSEVSMNKKIKTGSGLVGIDSLPDGLIERILTRLPITEAIGTSLLSRAWRYQWRHMSDLVFDWASLFDGLEEDEADQNERKLVGVVTRVLLLHVGKIKRFQYTARLESFYELHVWMNVLRNADIEELTLAFDNDGVSPDPYNMPSTLFGCNKLKYLSLDFCGLQIPPCFQGFDNLTTVVLAFVEFEDKTSFETLIRRCRILQRLSLRHCTGIDKFNIVSTTLVYFSLEESHLHDLRFDAPVLASIELHLYHCVMSTIAQGGGTLDIINGLPNLEKLQLFDCSLQVLAFKNTFSRTIVPFQKLKTLSVEKFNCRKQTNALLQLIRTSPELEKLYIHDLQRYTMINSTRKSFKIKQDLSFKFNCLRDLRISCLCHDATAIIQFLRSNAPLLGEVVAYFGPPCHCDKLMPCYRSSN